MGIMERTETPLALTESNERARRAGVRIASALAGVAFAAASLFGIDAELAKANDTPDAPTTSVIDHDITWTPDPESEAKLRPVNPELIEKCRKSKFVVINFSGTGMETSHYAANILQNLVEELGGCSMYHWYGHIYDPEASAESVESAIESVTPAGQKKQVVFIGASFGGIAAEDIALEPAVANSNKIDLKKIIMLMTPMDMNDVTDNFFGIPVTWLDDVPVPEFGGLTVLGNAIKGQAQREQLLDGDEWNNTFINAAKTRPRLMRSELIRIEQGLRKVRPDVSVSYVASPDSDPTVNDWQACQRLAELFDDGTVSYVELKKAGHDKGWLVAESGKYNPKIGDILQNTFGLAA